MEFNFIDKSKFSVTKYSYKDFDIIVDRYGYKEEKNGFLHTYFDWSEIKHWFLDYESYDEMELANCFKKSIVYAQSANFLIRLDHHQPLIEIKFDKLIESLDDLSHETGMGWEAISLDGKYIIEFTDGYEHLAKTNFEILAGR